MRSRKRRMAATLGVLAAGGLAALAQNATPAGVVPEVGRGVSFADLDKDANGSISLDEYEAAMAALAKERFRAIDTDGNGQVSASELRTALDAIAPVVPVEPVGKVRGAKAQGGHVKVAKAGRGQAAAGGQGHVRGANKGAGRHGGKHQAAGTGNAAAGGNGDW